jgi:hypothetical protein
MRALALAVALVAFPAHADPPPDLADLPGLEPPVDDLVPHAHPLDEDPPEGASLSLSLATVERPDARDWSASVLFTLPTDFFASRPPPRDDRDHEAKAKEAPLEPTLVVEPPPLPAPRVELPRLRPADVRAAVAAAAAHAGLDEAADALDDTSTRARWSALLPEIRLRATRLVDEQESLSPTEYDPTRVTATGGASLWLEARGTWSLDRLVFASDELRVDKLRFELRQERMAESRRIVALLFDWQRAAYTMYDPAIDPERCLAAWLTAEEHAAALDVATGGWLDRWLRAHPLPARDCTEAGQVGATDPQSSFR